MTSKTETAKQLIAIVDSENRRPKERLEALLQADALRREMKIGWAKLGAEAEGIGQTKAILEKLVAEEAADDAEVEAEFELSPEELADQALRPKNPEHRWEIVPGQPARVVDWPVEGAAQAEHQSDFVPPTVVSDAPKDDEPPKASEAPQTLTAAERGAIGIMARDLLQTDAPYEEIALAIRARYPHAKTTARSLASVAADMRRDGIPCPPRRKGGK